MTEPMLNPYQDIESDQQKRRNELEKQIVTITIRQQELQNYINILDNIVQSLEMAIQQIQTIQPIDYNKISNLRKALSGNIELINELYKTYNGYEDTKLKCQKEINDSTFKFTQLMKISIRQLDEKSSNYSNEDFMSMLMALNKMINENKNTGAPIIFEKQNTEFATDTDYNL